MHFNLSSTCPVIPLGHFGTKQFVYFIRQTEHVIELSAAQHAQKYLIGLASTKAWRDYKDAPRLGDEIDWNLLADHMMELCRKAGPFNPFRVRGRGAWRDDSRVVYHAGSALYVDGVRQELREFTSTEFVYERQYDLLLPARNSITADRVQALEKTLSSWRFACGALGPKLVLGWIGCALICGALSWRPHLWITGAKGTGKSTLITLISGLLGELAFTAQAGTSEPGLRQSLNGDTRPMLFDEFEAENPNSRAIIEAARVAASDNSAPIAKGTPNGKPILYLLRFAGLFAGINAHLENEADRSRFALIELDEVDYSASERANLVASLRDYTQEFGAALLGRMLDSLKKDRFERSLETLRETMISQGGGMRAADLFGNILAAWHVLTHDSELSGEEASALIHEVLSVSEDEPSDAEEAITNLLGFPVTVNGFETRSVGQWLEQLITGEPEGSDQEAIESALEQLGIRHDGYHVLVAQSSPGIRRVFANTPWRSGAHVRHLLRLRKYGAHRWPSRPRFHGAQSRAIAFDWRKLQTPDKILSGVTAETK